MDVEIYAERGGSVKTPKITHYGSVCIEFSTLREGESVEVILRSIPDPYFAAIDSIRKDRIIYCVTGEARIRVTKNLVKQGFTLPLFFDPEKWVVEVGVIHDSNLNRDRYINLRRA